MALPPAPVAMVPGAAYAARPYGRRDRGGGTVGGRGGKGPRPGALRGEPEPLRGLLEPGIQWRCPTAPQPAAHPLCSQAALSPWLAPALVNRQTTGPPNRRLR